MFKRTNFLLAKIKNALHVAEKPSVARTISEILSNRNYIMGKSFAKYNPIYEFETLFNNQSYKFNITSARGHIMDYSVPEAYSKWVLEDIEKIYTVDLEKRVSQDCLSIRKNIEKCAK
jgi:DNA topoisomerase-3